MVQWDEVGMAVWSARPQRMAVEHLHTDIECNFIHEGSLRYFWAGRFQSLRAGQLYAFWAGIPHRLVETAPRTRVTWVTVPLAWFLQWDLSEGLTRRLLGGELVEDTDDGDERRLGQWVRDLRTHRLEARRIVMLEVEARLRRMSLRNHGTARNNSQEHDGSEHVERMAAYAGRHFQEALSVKRIADAVGLHPNYAMQLFKRSCGMGLWEYLVRLRVSHAQRLLVTTDWKVQRVAMESGFGATSRFYEAFAKVSGSTPREYRNGMRGISR